MAENDKDREKRRQIQEMLGLESEEEVDPELVALANEQRSQSVLRPILFVAVIALGVWIISDWSAQIRYYFSSSEPAAIGEVTEFASKRADDENWKPELPHNRYVSLSGVPSRRSHSGKYRYFKLIGSNIYVEQPRKNSGEGEQDKEKEDQTAATPDRTFFEGEGQLLEFSKVPERYRGVRDYYREAYGTRFCGLLSDREEERLREVKRNAIRESWREEYRNASEEERIEKGLKAEPSDEEIEDIMEADPVCVDAHLLRATVSPSDHWWYLVVAGLFGLFMLVNAYWLVRWFVRFFGSGPIPDLDED